MSKAIQQQYKLHSAYITADRFAGRKIYIQNNIVEVVLYESLEKPYITGQIVVVDDAAIFDTMGFSGTERLFIDITSEYPDSGSTLKNKGLNPDNVSNSTGRSFIMSSIEKTVKDITSATGSSSTYLITLIEEHAILNKAIKISRTVQNDLVEEITKLCAKDLKKDVDLSYSGPAAQSNFKGIIPYLNPLEAAEWLRDRATTENGSPFFLYASIHDNNIRLGNLDIMLEQKAFNSKRPYTYFPANGSKVETQGMLAKSFQIQSMKVVKMQNTMTQLMAGGIGSLYNNTNLSTGQISSGHYDITKTINKLIDSGVIKKSTVQNIYDEYFTIDNTQLHKLNARVFHTVTSTGTYGNFKSYHDEVTVDMFMKKIESLAIRNMLYKNMFEVSIPGVGFIMAGASVGDIVRLNVISDNSLLDQKDSKKLDAMKSGDFLIYNTRHQFKETRHDVVMTVCKIVKDLDK